MRERFDHLFSYAPEGVKADAFIDTMAWAQRTACNYPAHRFRQLTGQLQMFPISAKQSKLSFRQATFTQAYIKQILGFVDGAEVLEISISPEFDLLLEQHRCKAAELVLKVLSH